MKLTRRTLIKSSAAVALLPLCMPTVARAAVRKVRIGHNNTLTSSLHSGAVAFQKFLSEKSEGRYDVEIFPSAQLGDENQMAKAVADGSLDAYISPMSSIGTYVPDVFCVEFPYMFSDAAAARKALDGSLGAYLAESLAKHSLQIVGWGENGVRHVTSNRPVRKPEDLKGLKIRVQPNKLHVEAFKGFGADAAPLPFSELAEALRSGKFEAQENPITVMTANEFLQKLQSHVSLTGHVYSPLAVVFSKDVFEEIKEGDRALVQGAGKAASQATRDFNDAALKSGLEKLKAAGMTIVTDVDVPAFQAAVAANAKKLSEVVGAESYARVKGLVA